MKRTITFFSFIFLSFFFLGSISVYANTKQSIKKNPTDSQEAEREQEYREEYSALYDTRFPHKENTQKKEKNFYEFYTDKYGEEINTNETKVKNTHQNKRIIIPGGKKCEQKKIITQNLKRGARDGKYSPYNRGVVTQVALLQEHMNRILKDEYGNRASGPVDGKFGPLTERGVKRLQRRLNQLLPRMKPLAIDGIVGPFTKQAINYSC